MNKLIKFELKRNSLKTYHIAVVIITVVILSFLYLLAAIPQIDAADSDTEMFMVIRFHNRAWQYYKHGYFFYNVLCHGFKIYC